MVERSPGAGRFGIFLSIQSVVMSKGGDRPVVVVSANWFNISTDSKLVIIVPLTTTDKPYPTHVLVEADAGDVRTDSWAMREQIRAVSFERFRNRRGELPDDTLARIRGIVYRILRE